MFDYFSYALTHIMRKVGLENITLTTDIESERDIRETRETHLNILVSRDVMSGIVKGTVK